ncbi:MAG: MFS transporter [Acidimicrobiales bacterium]
MGDTVAAPRTRDATSLAGTTFWFLWINAVSLSLIGSADRFAFLWLVEDTLDSPTWASGLIVFSLGAPVCALVLTAGALADRHDRRRMLLVTQVAGIAVLTTGAVLVWSGVMNLALAVVVAVAFGSVMAFAMPVRSSLVPVLVGTERVMQAVVLMTVGSNVAMIGGPLLVGGVIERSGVGWAFVVQAAGFGVGLLAALRIRVPPHPPAAHRRELRAEIAEALRFVWRHPVLRPLFVLLVVGGSLMGGPAFTLLPRIARDEFGREASEAARLFALMGIGMVVTSLVLMRFRSRLRRRGPVFMGFMLLGTADQVFQGVVPSFGALELLLLAWGLTGGMYSNLNQALIQELTPRDRMGRVMALSTMVNAGLLPIGGLLSALVASAIGPRPTVSLCGALAAVCIAATLWRSRELRALR